MGKRKDSEKSFVSGGMGGEKGRGDCSVGRLWVVSLRRCLGTVRGEKKWQPNGVHGACGQFRKWA